MDTNLISVIGGIVILAIVILVTFLALKKRNNNNAEAAIKFLDGLGDELLKIVIKTIKEVDPSKISSAEEFEVIVLNSIYDNAWDYVVTKINENFEQDSVFAMIMNTIDKDFVIKFIDNLCEKNGITSKIQGEYAAYQLRTSNIEEEDKKLTEKYADDQKYFTGEVSDGDLEPAAEPVHTEEEIAALNPQKDEIDGYDDNDDSVEEINDEVQVIVDHDKNGNTLYYEVSADGRKKRVSKDYALPILKAQVDASNDGEPV